MIQICQIFARMRFKVLTIIVLSFLTGLQMACKSGPDEITDVSAQELFRVYEAQLADMELYEGKWIRVHGLFASEGEDLERQQHFAEIWADPDGFYTVRGHFDQQAWEGMKLPESEDSISFVGKVEGLFGFALSMKDCRAE
jgi:hypothetical protein